MNKLALLKLIHKEEEELYEVKNKKYGDSFADTYFDFGLIASIIRIGDKFNRFTNLVKQESSGTSDESIRDTLIDLSNYANMTIIEMDNSTHISDAKIGSSMQSFKEYNNECSS